MRFIPRPPSGHGIVFGMLWRLAVAILGFLLLSVAMAAIYSLVPPPVTWTMIADPHGFTSQWTPLARIDRSMVDAVIAGEDSRFCEHHGFDSRAIERALAHDEAGKRLRGGSTISQQTAKNAFLWQGSGWDRYLRKGLEAWFTVLIEHLWGKRRIMEVYLNLAQTGPGIYGVEAAAEHYFGHGAAQLTPVEAARIAAALPSPVKRPVIAPHGFVRRHGNAIAARSGVVRRGDLDACVYD